MRKFSWALLAIAAMCVGEASARPIRVTAKMSTVESTSCAGGSCQKTTSTTESLRVSGPVAGIVIGDMAQSQAQDALDEVNAARAARGLPPFVRDPGLTQGAMNVAVLRASRLTQGHTANDFAGLPPGSSATASGCAAWPASLGWGACCTYDRYTHAGAAWATGSDGRRYMQLFVR